MLIYKLFYSRSKGYTYSKDEVEITDLEIKYPLSLFDQEFERLVKDTYNKSLLGKYGPFFIEFTKDDFDKKFIDWYTLLFTNGCIPNSDNTLIDENEDCILKVPLRAAYKIKRFV